LLNKSHIFMFLVSLLLWEFNSYARRQSNSSTSQVSSIYQYATPILPQPQDKQSCWRVT